MEMLIGQKIKELRKISGFSQEDLSEQINISRQTISSWENEKTYPDLQSIVLLADTFNITVEKLIGEDVLVMREELSQKSKNKIKRNKDRELINRLTAARLITAVLGGILLFPVYQYFDFFYLIIPVTLLFLTAILTIPIEKLRRKYQLKNYQEVVAFFDEKYQ